VPSATGPYGFRTGSMKTAGFRKAGPTKARKDVALPGETTEDAKDAKGTALQRQTGRLFGGAEGEEILGAFDGFLEAAEELLEVFAAFDKVDVGSIYHE